MDEIEKALRNRILTAWDTLMKLGGSSDRQFLTLYFETSWKRWIEHAIADIAKALPRFVPRDQRETVMERLLAERPDLVAGAALLLFAVERGWNKRERYDDEVEGIARYAGEQLGVRHTIYLGERGRLAVRAGAGD